MPRPLFGLFSLKLNTRLDSQLAHGNCHMFSTGIGSGERDGRVRWRYYGHVELARGVPADLILYQHACASGAMMPISSRDGASWRRCRRPARPQPRPWLPSVRWHRRYRPSECAGRGVRGAGCRAVLLLLTPSSVPTLRFQRLLNEQAHRQPH